MTAVSSLLEEDDQNYVEFTLAASSEGRLTEGVFDARAGEALNYLYRRVASRTQTAENGKTAFLDLNKQPSSAAGREL